MNYNHQHVAPKNNLPNGTINSYGRDSDPCAQIRKRQSKSASETKKRAREKDITNARGR